MIHELIERLTEEAGKRNMDFLLIGGQAVISLGHQRMTMDLDFLVPASNKAGWEDLLARYGYRCFTEANAFAQFEGEIGWPRIDLMLVDEATFAKLRADSVVTQGRRTPSPQHMVALKLHASRSRDRDPQKAGQDWLDIRKLIELHRLDPNEETFASLIRRYGGDEALARIRQMCQA